MGSGTYVYQYFLKFITSKKLNVTPLLRSLILGNTGHTNCKKNVQTKGCTTSTTPLFKKSQNNDKGKTECKFEVEFYF